MSIFDKAAFYDALRTGLMEPSIDAKELEGIEAILGAMAGTPTSHCAYALATAYHETNRTMQPVAEAYWLKNAEAWRKAHLRYYPWYGRGFVQTTWEPNYERLDAAAAKAGLTRPGEILSKPDLAMRIDIAALAMRSGMEDGWFTGHTLKQACPDPIGTESQFEDARRIINGSDMAQSIAHYALHFQTDLQNAYWS